MVSVQSCDNSARSLFFIDYLNFLSFLLLVLFLTPFTF